MDRQDIGGPHRTEEDLLGPLALPADALYGVRTWRCVLNMSFSGRRLATYPVLIQALAQVKKAAAVANQRVGLLEGEHRDAIVWACDELIAGRYLEHFVVDVFAGGGSIALNVNCNEVIANLASRALGGALGAYAPIHPKTHVNASQSTADVCHSAQNIAIMRLWLELDAVLAELAAAARRKACELQDVAVIARTCLQDAMAAWLGDSFGAIATMLGRRRDELGTAVAKLKSLNLGGTVIGSGEGASEPYRRAIIGDLRQITGLDVRLADDLFDAAQNIDTLAAVSSQLALLAGALVKVAKDLRLMSSGPLAGFGEIALPAAQEGSSFFQGKINPVIPETLIQCCFLVEGADRAVKATLEHGELNLNVFEGAAGVLVLDSLGQLTRCLRLFVERCFGGIQASGRRSAQYEEALRQLGPPAARSKPVSS